MANRYITYYKIAHTYQTAQQREDHRPRTRGHQAAHGAGPPLEVPECDAPVFRAVQFQNARDPEALREPLDRAGDRLALRLRSRVACGACSAARSLRRRDASVF